MSEETDMFLDSFQRLLGDVCTPAAVRAVHQGADSAPIWDAIAASGFVDAMLAEDNGGVALAGADLAPLLVEAGRHLVPVAFGHTAVARMLIASAGHALPVEGPILLWPTSAQGGLRSQVAPAAFEAGHALVQHGASFRLLPLLTESPVDGFGFPSADVDMDASSLLDYVMDDCCLLEWAAGLTALASAGAIDRVVEMSVQYVTERQQFGRPLGNFQAIQHLAAQAVEQSVLAGTAARIIFSGGATTVDALRVGVAKALTGIAAGEVTRIAHALHGAIGISEEHDLQLYTRQLKRWQLSYGAQDYWSARIGTARLADAEGSSVDFIRDRLAARVG